MIGPPAHPARDDKAARSPTSVWHGDAPARERRPLASSPGGGRHRCAQRSERDGPRTVGWSVQQRVLQQGQWCRCGTSRQLAVRGSPACGGRCRPEVGVPSGPRDFARGGVLLSAQKTMAANSVRCRRDGRCQSRPHATMQSDAPARERRPLVGTAARSAANGTDLEQWGGPYSNGYFSRGSGAGAGHPAGWRYVVRPPAAGGADRRSAFQAVPAILRVVAYC